MKQPDRSTPTRLLRALLLLLFALSGAAGLIYEIGWVRQFTLVLGASVYAVTIVLAVFMSGLGIGAWWMGERADRFGERQLVVSYVLLELGIALYGLVFPLLLASGQAAYAAFYQSYQPGLWMANALRLVIAFLLLILPTSLMGATLPVLSRYVVRTQMRIPVTVSWLYGVNTLGALLGTMAAGYVLLPALGVRQTTLVAVALNLFVAVAFGGVARWTRRGQADGAAFPAAEPVARAPRLSGLEWGVVAAFAVSGFAAMLYEVAWTRTLTLVLGTTTFSFTTMLATFLLGIALGSVLFARWQRLASPMALFIALQFVVAFSVVATMPFWERLPLVYLSLHRMAVTSWAGLQCLRFGLAALVMLLPTLALGATLPAVVAILVPQADILGRRLGAAYGLNTLGAVLGASLGGLVLVPTLGMQQTILVGAVLNFFAGALVLLLWTGCAARRRAAVFALVTAGLVAGIALVRPWSPWLLTSGVYVYADRYQAIIDRVEAAANDRGLAELSTWQLWQLAMEQYELLYYQPGRTGTVAVMQRHDGVRFLSIDGKTDASTGAGHDMKTQGMLAQLPLLFHPAPDKVFVVGFGSGVTAGSVLTHPVRLVDCAELSGAVLQASRYFADVNGRPWRDPRLRLLERDARNVLLTTPERYDVVISQPSNPWIGGQSSLFSFEWYRMVSAHLEPDGLFVQWLPAYHMAGSDVRVILHTLRTVFPHVTVWTSGAEGDVVLLAKRDGRLVIDCQQLQARLRQPAVAADLGRLGFAPAELPFAAFVMNEEELAAYLDASPTTPELNTDDRLITEFSTPKQLVRANVVDHFASATRGKRASLRPLLRNLSALGTLAAEGGD